MARNRTVINIFLVYFFLTFTIGFLDFDRRVESFDSSVSILKDIAQGQAEVGPPYGRRILIPFFVYSFHKVLGLALNYSYALFRFILFFLSFVLFHIYLKKWFDDKTAMIGTLSMMASLPLILTNWSCVPTDIPELITFILGAMWIRDNKYKNLYFLIPIASFNRETAVALVLLYFICQFGREKFSVLLKRTGIYFILWFIPTLFLLLFFTGIESFLRYERAVTFSCFGRNIRGLAQIFSHPNLYNQYYFLFYLCGFYWILAFCNFRKKDTFLKRSMIVMVVYFLYVFIKAGAINEVRMFLPFYVFIIPLGLFSLFNQGNDVKG